ncbi:MAG: DUF4437 domain-containing protein [Bacteroidota bacterium]
MNRTTVCFLTLTMITWFGCGPSEPQSATQSETPPTEATIRVVHRADIPWEQLNPARGDQSPLAGTVWGDRQGSVATGFFAKFVDGFSSPPHIHNVTYRAVVIKGLIHNDDPEAEFMWMPPGSFWTQPVGEAHITAAQGEENIAYVEIDRGPYLVKPTSEAFDSGERPVNVDASNVVWLGASQSEWIAPNCSAELSYLWESQEQGGVRGLFLKLPPQTQTPLTSEGKDLHLIVAQGSLGYQQAEVDAPILLESASYLGAAGPATLRLSNAGTEDCVLYVRTDGSIGLK